MSSRDWESLIHRHLDGVATSEEVAELSERLESDTLARLRYLRVARIHATLAADDFDEPSMRESENRFSDLMEQLVAFDKRRRFHRFVISVAAVAAMITLIAGIYIYRPRVEPRIATITLVDGAIRWTGDGGQVSDNVGPDRELTGGTLESLSADSSATFEFRDGSAVTISGPSALTISDDGRKELHLREGNLSATVTPQPKGKPLRLLTPTAELEVLGTQFDVTAADTQTKITVNEGLVRVTRLTDGKFTDVKAAHSLVATIEAREPLVAIALEKPVSAWKANLPKDMTWGDWQPIAEALRIEIAQEIEAGELDAAQAREVYFKRLAKFGDDDGFLQAHPRRTGHDEPPVIYLITLDIPQRQSGPVLLAEGSRLRVKGRSRRPNEVTFSLAARSHDRSIMGRYGVTRRVEATFDIEIEVTELKQLGDGTSAVGLEAFVLDCFSNETGLELSHVELLGPG